MRQRARSVTTCLQGGELPGIFCSKGSFIIGNSSINVRSEPSTSAKVVATYDPGEKINYDLRGSENGYDWISYESHSGKRRYVAIGKTSEPGYWGDLRPD